MTQAENILFTLKERADPERAVHSQKFFKTGIGEYGEGDIFLGIRVPVIRKAVKKYKSIHLDDTLQLLKSNFHEVRLFALLAMVQAFNSGSEEKKKAIFQNYINNTRYINNWDLIDSSAPHIVGNYLWEKDKTLLYSFAESSSLWERRIAIIATQFFIKQKSYQDTLKISDILLNDTQDLIHKAVGWMLREIGNRNLEIEEQFLKTRYLKMPRTMLRYAIEKFEEEKRQKYLKGLM